MNASIGCTLPAGGSVARTGSNAQCFAVRIGAAVAGHSAPSRNPLLQGGDCFRLQWLVRGHRATPFSRRTALSSRLSDGLPAHDCRTGAAAFQHRPVASPGEALRMPFRTVAANARLHENGPHFGFEMVCLRIGGADLHCRGDKQEREQESISGLHQQPRTSPSPRSVVGLEDGSAEIRLYLLAADWEEGIPEGAKKESRAEMLLAVSNETSPRSVSLKVAGTLRVPWLF